MLFSRTLTGSLLTASLLCASAPAAALHVVGEGDPRFHQPSGHSGHGEPVNLAATDPVPTIELEVTADPVSGWNVHIEVTQFEFAPQHSGFPHVAGEGHAHIYVNGEKLARMYGKWFHIDALPAGRVTVAVSLNANDHRPIAVSGREIFATQVIEVSEEKAGKRPHH